MAREEATHNRWYVLMTLFGELDPDDPKYELYFENPRVWNAWSCQNIDQDQRNFLEALDDNGIKIPEDGAWEEMEGEVREALAKRSPTLAYEDLPKPSEMIDLAGLFFPKPCNARNLIIPNEMDLVGAIFSKSAEFGDCVFFGTMNLRLARFERGVSFRNSIFSKRARFKSVKFERDADFSGVKFSGVTDFSFASFAKVTTFERSEFSKDVFFPSVEFSNEVDFSFCNFGGVSDFTSTIYRRNAYFNGCVFRGPSFFTSTLLHEDGYFRSAVFESRVDLVGARFGNEKAEASTSFVDLTDSQFDKPANLRNAVFADYYPDFTGAVFHDKSLIPWEAENWPDALEQDPRQGRDSCAFLRHHLSRQGLPEAELFFFKREMKFAENIGGAAMQFPYRFYGWISDYGSSIIKPCVGIFLIWLIPAVVYLFAFNLIELNGRTQFGPFEPFTFSFANIFKFFGLQRVYFGDTLIALPAWIQTIAALQTVAGFVVLFFLGLGLRQRFRLR